MARVGEVSTTCDLCGEYAGYGANRAETDFKVKGKPLVIETQLGGPDLCAKCLAGIIADGRVLPIRWSNAPFFIPGLFLGMFAAMVLMRLLGKL